jgi:hypothetical protein
MDMDTGLFDDVYTKVVDVSEKAVAAERFRPNRGEASA